MQEREWATSVSSTGNLRRVAHIFNQTNGSFPRPRLFHLDERQLHMQVTALMLVACVEESDVHDNTADSHPRRTSDDFVLFASRSSSCAKCYNSSFDGPFTTPLAPSHTAGVPTSIR